MLLSLQQRKWHSPMQTDWGSVCGGSSFMLFQKSLNILLLLYRYFISPFLHMLSGPMLGCRFVPTCSEYSKEALHEHGCFKGVVLSLRRISRCHPFSRAGFDPVPRGIAKSLNPN